MTDPSQPPRFPSWVPLTVVVMLGLQLALTWVQGRLLQRQHQDLVALREDVQVLADCLDQEAPQEDYEAEGLAPARQLRIRRPSIRRVAMLQEEPSEDDPAKKDLEATKASARKAVGEAREVQSKLSIAENVRKAEERARMDEAGNTWQKWLWAALGAGLAAVGVRAWLRRRG